MFIFAFKSQQMKQIWSEYRPDLIIYLATFLLCLFFDMAYGILIMIFVNMITFIRPVVRMAIRFKTDQHKAPNGETYPVTVIKLSHGMKYELIIILIKTHHFIRSFKVPKC